MKENKKGSENFDEKGSSCCLKRQESSKNILANIGPIQSSNSNVIGGGLTLSYSRSEQMPANYESKAKSLRWFEK